MALSPKRIFPFETEKPLKPSLISGGSISMPIRLHSSIYSEDFDYDKDGNIMSEYDIDNFGHRETYRVYKCNICGKEKRERLQ